MSDVVVGRRTPRGNRRALDKVIIEHFRTVSRAMDKLILPVLVDRGLTMMQYKALLAVTGRDSGLAVSCLGRELSIPQPSATLVVDRLVLAGYVRRETDTTDRRRVLVSATSAGEELVDELRSGSRHTFTQWLQRVEDGDAQDLASGLAALARATMDCSGVDKSKSRQVAEETRSQ